MIQQILNCLPRINDCRSVVLCNFRCYISITFSIIRYLGEQTFHNSFLLGYCLNWRYAIAILKNPVNNHQQ